MKFLSRVKMKGRKIPPMLKSLGYVGTILANLKWIIVSAIIVCALLSVPNQLLELYRAAVAEDGPIRYAKFVSSYSAAELLSILVIGILFWFGAILIAAQTSQAFPASLGQSPHRVLQALTSAIGAAPILAVGIAQFMALPDLKTPFPLSVGTIIRVEKDLLESVYRRLSLFGCIFVISAIGFAWLAGLLYARMVPIAARINAAYFTRLRFLITSAVIIFGLVVIVVSFPVSLPQRLGPFVVLATFTLCIVAACVHLSLYAMKYRFPFIAIIMLYALGIMACDWNDDHFAREFSASVEQRAIVAEPRMNAGEAFIKWLQSRTELDTGPAATHWSSSPKPYPVSS
jgi:hypothetical protein